VEARDHAQNRRIEPGNDKSGFLSARPGAQRTGGRKKPGRSVRNDSVEVARNVGPEGPTP